MLEDLLFFCQSIQPFSEKAPGFLFCGASFANKAGREARRERLHEPPLAASRPLSSFFAFSLRSALLYGSFPMCFCAYVYLNFAQGWRSSPQASTECKKNTDFLFFKNVRKKRKSQCGIFRFWNWDVKQVNSLEFFHPTSSFISPSLPPHIKNSSSPPLRFRFMFSVWFFLFFFFLLIWLLRPWAVCLCTSVPSVLFASLLSFNSQLFIPDTKKRN